MLDRNLLQSLQRFKSGQALLSLGQHGLAMGNARFDQGGRLGCLGFDPAGASFQSGADVAITQSTGVVRPCENLEECRQRVPGLLTVHRHRACGIRAQPDRTDTKKPPQMGGRVMGISTAYLNEPVIAGYLKKRRHRRMPNFSTALWISRSKMVRVSIDPLDVVDKLHKLDEKHYTYEIAR